jgi:hypothetical protein
MWQKSRIFQLLRDSICRAAFRGMRVHQFLASKIKRQLSSKPIGAIRQAKLCLSSSRGSYSVLLNWRHRYAFVLVVAQRTGMEWDRRPKNGSRQANLFRCSQRGGEFGGVFEDRLGDLIGTSLL